MRKIIVRTAEFGVATNDGIVYLTTKCCGTDATGVSVTAANPEGIACRGCYTPIPTFMGWAALTGMGAEHLTADQQVLTDILRAANVPQPEMTAERVFIEARADVKASAAP